MATISSFLLIAVTLVALQQSDALKCYSCDPACAATQDKVKECGDPKILGADQEAVCITDVEKGKESTPEAIRKCTIVKKGEKYTCPKDHTCNQCTSDLCNEAPSTSPTEKPSTGSRLAPSVGNQVQVMGAIAALFILKAFY